MLEKLCLLFSIIDFQILENVFCLLSVNGYRNGLEVFKISKIKFLISALPRSVSYN